MPNVSKQVKAKASGLAQVAHAKMNVAQRRRHNRDLALQLVKNEIATFASIDKDPIIPRFPQLDTNIPREEIDKAIAEHREKTKKEENPEGSDPIHVGATLDHAVIKHMWKEAPDAVPSISCGANGLLVLDADTKRNGPEQLKVWMSQNGLSLDDYPVTVTQSGGLHVFMKNGPDNPLGNESGAFFDMGVDVRGAGGQVIAPGAIREDGKRYTAREGSPHLFEAMQSGLVPDIPQAVRDMIASRPKNKTSVNSEDERAAIERLATKDWPAFDELTDGTLGRFDLDALAEKDDEFAAAITAPDEDKSTARWTLAKCLHREYGDALDVLDFAALLEHYNDDLDGAFGVFVGDDKPQTGEYSFRSIARDFLRSKNGFKVSDGSAFGVVEEIDDYLPRHVKEARERREAEKEQKQKKTRKLTFISFADVARFALDEIETPLIDGLLDEGAMSVMYGDSNVGKSFVALDMAFHIATGRPWNGRETKRGLVIYVAAEGGKRIGKRLAALRQHFGEEADSAKLAIVPAQIDLRSANGDTSALIELIREAEAQFRETAVLVVIDTASRAMAGGDENSPVDMGALVKHCDKVRDAVSAHLMLIHHTGKDTAKGARGHSLLRAATDTEIEIKDSKIITKKQRDMDFAPEIPFVLRKVDLGSDRNGKPRSSAVVEAGVQGSAPPSGRAAAQALRGNQAELFAVIVSMATERGIAAGQEPHSVTLPFVDVRARVEARRKADGTKEIGDSIRSVKRCLLDKRVIVEPADGMVKLPGPGDLFGAVDDDEGAD